MRIFIVDTHYPAFLESHYSDRPGLAEEPYDLQWRALMDRFFGTSDAYSHYLGDLGHEAHEVVANCDQLQRAWANEHGVKPGRRFGPSRGLWPLQEQVEEFKPDVIYVQDLNVLGPELLRELRTQAQLLAGQISSATPSRRRLALYDLLVTSFPHFVRRFRADGIASEYFRLGFDTRVLEHLPNESAAHDAVFVGALGRSRTWRSNAVLERAAERVPIDLWGYKAGAIPFSPAVRRQYHGEAWGIDMYRVLAGARVAVNRHGGIAQGHANNMRLYEATGVGTLLITDAQQNLPEILEPDEEVVTYASTDELIEKIEHYLSNESERVRSPDE
jgi:spore maturation protein CgeB